MNLKISYRDVDTALRAQKMFNLRQKSMTAFIGGNFREVRRLQKEFAKMAVEDFETFKTLPEINFCNVSFFQIVSYKIFSMFVINSQEEKLLIQKYTEYRKENGKKNQIGNRIDLTI